MEWNTSFGNFADEPGESEKARHWCRPTLLRTKKKARATGRGTAGSGCAGLPQARGEDRRAQRPSTGLRRADGHRTQEVQRGPGAGLCDGRVRGDVRGLEPHLWHHRTRPGADPRLLLQRRCQAHQGHAQDAHPEGMGAHGAPRLGPPSPQPRPGPHHPHRGANGAAMSTDEDDQDGHFFYNHPERGVYFAA